MSGSDNPCRRPKDQSTKIIGKQNNKWPENNSDIHQARRRIPDKNIRNNKKNGN
ncbi:hypothetical protein K0B04_03265 [Patescibacteria group bacterium]|nr:hypothetical protein [Patescibacteria group bacterium]